MLSLLCLLFYDAFSDHACVFLCVSVHLEPELPTQQETPTQRTMTTQDSRCVGVIRALVLILPSETV